MPPADRTAWNDAMIPARTLAARLQRRQIRAISWVRGSLRLAAQDVALSRRKQGFESPRERQQNQTLLVVRTAPRLQYLRRGFARSIAVACRSLCGRPNQSPTRRGRRRRAGMQRAVVLS